ncbi:MAG: 50S ribosomal protein L30 [Christensenella sp.]
MNLKIKLVKSPIGYAQNQKDTLKALGLRKMGKVVTQPDNPPIRGMVFTVKHLVSVEEVK